MTTSNATLQQAVQFLQRGELIEAGRVLDALVLAEPANFAALQLLGVVWLERGDPQRALLQFERARNVDATVASLFYNRGNAFSALERLDEAAASYQAALELNPALAEAHYNRGNALRGLGRPAEALASYQQAVALRPALFQAHNNIGSVLQELGRLPEAVASFDRALAAQPGHVEALYNRGMVLLELRFWQAALASFDAALALAPGWADAHANRGLALRALERHDEAIASYDRALALDPGHANALNNRGIALHETRRHAEALASYDRAIALQPEFPEAWNNRGNALHDLRRMDEAFISYQRAISLRPDYAEAINNRGMIAQDLHKLEAARADYDAAIALRPDYAEAYQRRANLKLLTGDFAGGLADSETSLGHARVQSDGADELPWWHGEDLAGKSILLSEPNGFGNTLQYFRFLPALLERGARVAFLGPRRAVRLLSAGADGVEFLDEVGGRRFDFQSWSWSLPHYLQARLPDLADTVPYLQAEPALVAKWAQVLDRDTFNIGICWQGNPERKIDAGRSIPLEQFLPLARLPGVRLVSLQKNFGTEQLQRLPEGMAVQTLGEDFDAGADAFVDSAALMQGLDLVISADTAIAHLAGALGRPCWVALTLVPDWRWMLERADSPWYPSLRLFRQWRLDDWNSVFAEMAEALRPILAARPARSR
jgi:tetratricopeptide (TPR) repeat protein